MDFLRDGVKVLAQALMEAEVEQRSRAGEHERTHEWRGHACADDGAIRPKLREDGYVPALLEPRCKAERALRVVVQETYVCRCIHAQGRYAGEAVCGWLASPRAMCPGSVRSSMTRLNVSGADLSRIHISMHDWMRHL